MSRCWPATTCAVERTLRPARRAPGQSRAAEPLVAERGEQLGAASRWRRRCPAASTMALPRAPGAYIGRSVPRRDRDHLRRIGCRLRRPAVRSSRVRRGPARSAAAMRPRADPGPRDGPACGPCGEQQGWAPAARRPPRTASRACGRWPAKRCPGDAQCHRSAGAAERSAADGAAARVRPRPMRAHAFGRAARGDRRGAGRARPSARRARHISAPPISAASVGVGARAGRRRGRSASCPSRARRPRSAGCALAAAARTTISSLKPHRSSIDAAAARHDQHVRPRDGPARRASR